MHRKKGSVKFVENFKIRVALRDYQLYFTPGTDSLIAAPFLARNFPIRDVEPTSRFSEIIIVI